MNPERALRLLGSSPPRTVVAWGELLWDLFPDGPRLGGAAANVAYHAAALGGRAHLVSRVGRDELGARAISLLGEAGVDTRWVSMDSERPTGTVRVDLLHGQPRFTIGEQVAWDEIRWSPELSREMDQADVVVFGTLAQRTPLAAGALSTALGRSGSATWHLCDLNLRPPFVVREVVESSLIHAHAVKLNEQEAAYVADLFGARDPIEWLLGRTGVRLVALTLGAEGAILATADERCRDPGVRLSNTGGDPVGAGDAFTAVLALLLGAGLPLPLVARAANRYASFVASAPGAMPPVPSEIRLELRRLLAPWDA